MVQPAGVNAPPLAVHDSRFTIHDWPKRLIAVQACLAAAVAPWYGAYGLHIDWRSAALLPVAHVSLVAAWWYCRRRYSTHPGKSIYADVILATLVLLLVTNIASPAQYLAVALRRPLIDDWLVRCRCRARHRCRGAGGLDPLAPYGVARPVSVLRVADRAVPAAAADHRPARWRPQPAVEYVFHFNFCLIVTVATLAIFPPSAPTRIWDSPRRSTSRGSSARLVAWGRNVLTSSISAISTASIHAVVPCRRRDHRDVGLPAAPHLRLGADTAEHRPHCRDVHERRPLLRGYPRCVRAVRRQRCGVPALRPFIGGGTHRGAGGGVASAAMACEQREHRPTERRSHAMFAPLPDHDADQGVDLHPATQRSRSTIIDVRIAGACSVQTSCSSIGRSSTAIPCARQRRRLRASGRPAGGATTEPRADHAASSA